MSDLSSKNKQSVAKKPKTTNATETSSPQGSKSPTGKVENLHHGQQEPDNQAHEQEQDIGLKWTPTRQMLSLLGTVFIIWDPFYLLVFFLFGLVPAQSGGMLFWWVLERLALFWSSFVQLRVAGCFCQNSCCCSPCCVVSRRPYGENLALLKVAAGILVFTTIKKDRCWYS
ncbi:unnamed protein product [Amoebophrya sp. A25]|nr:unnamed protein product [Amoebophrya sp. A25]|eukprot:GSA25T00008171001.1